MSLQLFDLPSELLFHILSYITNIREKIRLASVDTRFYNLVIEACRIQNYKLINHSDYMYEKEYKKLDNNERIINLHKLLQIAPRLTHLVDKVYHFDYKNPNSDDPHVPVPLIHTKYLSIDLSHSYFFGKPYVTATDHKVALALSNIPEVTVLAIRADKEFIFNFPLLNNLKVFKFDLYPKDHWAQSPVFPKQLIDMIIEKSPNLEEIYFSSKQLDSLHDSIDLMKRLAIKCPNLRAIKMLRPNAYSFRSAGSIQPIAWEKKFLKLEYLDIRGLSMEINIWHHLLSMAPNLKFLAVDSSNDPQIKRVISANCPRAKYNLERPFEIEEEFRIYNQQTYGFNSDLNL